MATSLNRGAWTLRFQVGVGVRVGVIVGVRAWVIVGEVSPGVSEMFALGEAWIVGVGVVLAVVTFVALDLR